MRLAKLVGRENVIAGTDCGFAQQPTLPARPSDHSVGEARGAGRRRAARDQGAVGQGQEGCEEACGEKGPAEKARREVDKAQACRLTEIEPIQASPSGIGSRCEASGAFLHRSGA